MNRERMELQETNECISRFISFFTLPQSVLFLGSLVLSPIAQAGYCTLLNSSGTTAFSNITVQRDVPVGTFLDSYQFPAVQLWNCSSVANVTRQEMGIKSYSKYNRTVGNGYTVYESDVSGIGFTIEVIGDHNYWYVPSQSSGFEVASSTSGLLASGNLQLTRRVRLIKIGAITSGTITAKKVGATTMKTFVSGVDQWETEVPISLNSFTITTLACSLTSTSINVPLGDVLASKFTGVGVTAGDKSFDLGLTCDKDAKINVSLAGTQNTDTSETSVLALTSAGQTGTASGVGVQLLYGGTPLKINNNILLKTSAGGQETLPFTARYYQTLADISAGLANSSATLNITYQ
ncbi:Type-1A pilin [Serratia quinivorans]|nr:Type-1A pilin [Serratia quinivorans]CAI2160454.1 Type-1A pilin [Serratia quinivorans]